MSDDRTLENIEREIGELSVRALYVGGEELLSRVESAMGVAIRLTGYVRAGRLPLVPGLQADVNDSLERARSILRDEAGRVSSGR